MLTELSIHRSDWPKLFFLSGLDEWKSVECVVGAWSTPNDTLLKHKSVVDEGQLLQKSVQPSDFWSS